MNNRFGDEEKLLAELGNRTPAAFERFYERYVPLVFQIALRMVGDRMEAEDLCQEIFLEAYRTVHQYDPERGSVEAWLAVKTRARCLDRLRRKKTELFGGFDQLERQPGPVSTEETVLAKLEREQLLLAINKIPEAQRQAVYGMYFQAKSHRELAERLERPLGTVKSLIRYGLTNLRNQLTELGWAGSSGGVKERE